HDTAPKGAETHPGDGRLSVGNSSSSTFRRNRAWFSQPAGSPNRMSETKLPRRRSAAVRLETPVEPSINPAHPPVDSPCGRWCKFNTTIRNPRGTPRCAARSDQNLSQVLKNMDSLDGKSTVQSSCHHFVSFFPSSTSPPIQNATRVDAGKH